MKLRKIYLFLLITGLYQFIVSCNDENEKFGKGEIYKVITEGLTINKKNEATIPAEGITFKVKVRGTKYSDDQIYISEYIIDEKFYWPGGYTGKKPPYFGSIDWLHGEWGEIIYLDDTPDKYYMEIRILPNPSHEERKFKFWFFKGNTGAILTLTQEGS